MTGCCDRRRLAFPRHLPGSCRFSPEGTQAEVFKIKQGRSGFGRFFQFVKQVKGLKWCQLVRVDLTKHLHCR